MLYKMNYILSISVVIIFNILLIIIISIIKLWYSYILLSWNKYSILDVVILNTNHELPPRSAGQWLTQKPYKKLLSFFEKNAIGHTTFVGRQNKVAWTYCACIIHPRPTIFSTHNLTMPIINNIKKFFKSI